ncbi:MAG: hypothetical protein Q7S72_01660 [Candidatus Taylorbacteria bacterium]|nr:hypothetical protein [Candidatus Taylorbacteria bacterium]
MKIGQRHYILIILAIASIATTIYGYIFIYRKTITQAEHYVHANKEFENEDIKKQSGEELLKIYNSSKESRARLKTFFVDSDKIVDFIEMVENVGVGSNTKLEISSITNDENKVVAKIGARGSWSGVITTLSLLENLPLSVSLSNIKLNTTSDSDKEAHEWNLSLDIEAIIIKSK